MAGSVESSNNDETVTVVGDQYLRGLSGVSTFVRVHGANRYRR